MLKEFEIPYNQLNIGNHHFDFNIKEGFFKQFPEHIIENGKGKVSVTLKKSETVIKLNLNIDCEIELTCDLSLEKFNYPINIEKELIFKFGNINMELDDSILMLNKVDTVINIAPFIHEFVTLEVPMKKVHPDYNKEDRPDLIYQSSTTPIEKEIVEEEIDPRWSKLKSLIKK